MVMNKYGLIFFFIHYVKGGLSNLLFLEQVKGTQ